ncbi:MAG: retroviral-like aspartic protease family protein [Methylococcales bacterium]|nr:retroviral-like aspartic protease family protein [Methylococcales bacterium]
MRKTDSASKIGQGMIYLAWLLLLALLTYGFNHYLEQQNNPNQDVETRQNNNTAEVRLIQNRYGHYLANGQINQQPVTFLLDTGATLISIPQSVAKRLQLKKGYPSQSRTANGTITVYGTRLKSVSVGLIELKNLRATINPHMEGNEVLLGMSFMKHLEMAQKGKELILRY